MAAKKTPPPFKLLKARKGQAVHHMLISVDLKGVTQVYELGPYELKNATNLAESVSRARADDAEAELYYAPVVLPIPKKARPVKTAKAKAKKVAKPKQEKVDTKQEAPKAAKKPRAKKATKAPAPAPEPESSDDGDDDSF